MRVISQRALNRASCCPVRMGSSSQRFGWPDPTHSTSARAAARSTPSGPGAATPAASGTRSPRRARRSRCPRACAPARRSGSSWSGWRAPLPDRRACPPRSPSSIACSAAVWSHGSTVLIGGDPGIGKSTLVLQAAAALARAGAEVAYVSGEESIDQIRLRAARLGVSGRAGPGDRGDLGARRPRHVRSGACAAAAGDRTRSRRCTSTASRRRPAR